MYTVKGCGEVIADRGLNHPAADKQMHRECLLLSVEKHNTAFYGTQSTEHLNMNSGLFYLRANERTLGLMKRIAARLSKEKAWDQSVYNQEIFFLSHDDYVAPHVTVRIMNIYKFMNSKVLFKEVRQQPRSSQVLPVMIHINYHPDKHARMLAVVKYYVDKDDHALEPFPGGSEPGS